MRTPFIMLTNLSIVLLACAVVYLTYLIFGGAYGFANVPDWLSWAFEVTGRCLGDSYCEYWKAMTVEGKCVFWTCAFLLLALLFGAAPRTLALRR